MEIHEAIVQHEGRIVYLVIVKTVLLRGNIGRGRAHTASSNLPRNARRGFSINKPGQMRRANAFFRQHSWAATDGFLTERERHVFQPNPSSGRQCGRNVLRRLQMRTGGPCRVGSTGLKSERSLGCRHVRPAPSSTCYGHQIDLIRMAWISSTSLEVQ